MVRVMDVVLVWLLVMSWISTDRIGGSDRASIARGKISDRASHVAVDGVGGLFIIFAADTYCASVEGQR